MFALPLVSLIHRTARVRTAYGVVAAHAGRPAAGLWLSLPLELLLRVLAFLGDQELMTARLVCREWRQASLTFMTHLNLNAWLRSTALGPSTASLKALTRCCHGLPNLSSLALRINTCEEASLLGLPGCASLLKRLHINFSFTSNLSTSRMVDSMTPTRQLTGLTLFSAYAPIGGVPFARAAYALFIRSSTLIVQQCKILCKVVLHNCGVEEWLVLLPLLADLSHLRQVGDIPLCDHEVVARVARMTWLTSVRGSDMESHGIHVQPLLGLPALRALRLEVHDGANWPTFVHAATRAALPLQHFAIQVCGDDYEFHSAAFWRACPLSRSWK